jgi:P27 family predicted phage terminase small subunit
MRGARPELRLVESRSDDQSKPSDVGLPLPPQGVPEAMHAEWVAVLADLKERRLLNDSMLGVVRSYVMAQWTAAQAEESIAEQGVFVSGAGGAMKPNPATGLLRNSRDMISRLAGELGLTPTSRARKSLRQASQDAPDLFGTKWDL